LSSGRLYGSRKKLATCLPESASYTLKNLTSSCQTSVSPSAARTWMLKRRSTRENIPSRTAGRAK
jgi:hypothetical protein